MPAAGYPLHTYRVTGLPRRLSLGLAARPRAGRAGARRRARASCAGCAPTWCSAAAGTWPGRCWRAAAALRIPAALLEVDAHLGLANRLAAPLARRVFLSFPIDGLDPPHYQVTGRPVPRAVLDATREQGRREFDLPADRRVVLVFGGSLGATHAQPAPPPPPGRPTTRLHGGPHHRRARVRACRPAAAAPHYRVLPYTASLGPLLAAADLVVSRAGGSVFEIAAAGRPSILVPSPNVTADHQTPNAAHIADGGAAIVIADAELTAVPAGGRGGRAAGRARPARRAWPRPPAGWPGPTPRADRDRAPGACTGDALRPQTAPASGSAAPACRRWRWSPTRGAPRCRAATGPSRSTPSGCGGSGSRCAEGHDRAHLEPGMEVVVSSAMPDELDELAAASELGLRVIGRGELLAELVALRRSICVGGAHGKTTTTAMIAYAAQRIGLDPTWLVGGEVPQLGGNAGPGRRRPAGGRGRRVRRQLRAPASADRRGHQHRPRPSRPVRVAGRGASSCSPTGSPTCRRTAPWCSATACRLPAGAAPVARFGVRRRRRLAHHRLPRPAGGIAVLALGARRGAAARSPQGAGRAQRPQRRRRARGAGRGRAPTRPMRRRRCADFTRRGAAVRAARRASTAATVVDDYAHNPAKVAAVIDAARTYAPARVVVCFQPHLYSRTAAAAHEFGAALAEADEVVVTEIYAARERPVAGVTAKLVVDAVVGAAAGHAARLHAEPRRCRRLPARRDCATATSC